MFPISIEPYHLPLYPPLWKNNHINEPIWKDSTTYMILYWTLSLTNGFDTIPCYYIFSIENIEQIYTELHRLLLEFTYVKEAAILTIIIFTSIMKLNISNNASCRNTSCVCQETKTHNVPNNLPTNCKVDFSTCLRRYPPMIPPSRDLPFLKFKNTKIMHVLLLLLQTIPEPWE